MMRTKKMMNPLSGQFMLKILLSVLLVCSSCCQAFQQQQQLQQTRSFLHVQVPSPQHPPRRSWRRNRYFPYSPEGTTAPGTTTTTSLYSLLSFMVGGRSDSSTNNIVTGEGKPSNVGWQSERLNRLTEWADHSKPNRPVVCEYQSSGFWLWKKWKGTVLKQTWKSVVIAMLSGLCFHFFVRWHYASSAATSVSWPWYSVPPMTKDSMLEVLAGVRKLWEFQLTICTFILSLFSSQSFTYWQTVYQTARKIQGRINDYCMLLVMGAQRIPGSISSHITGSKGTTNEEQDNSNNNVNGSSNINGDDIVNGSYDDDEVQSQQSSSHESSYSRKGRSIVSTCTRLIRMSHIFFWAATPTASNGLSDSEKFIMDTANCPLPLDDEHIGPVLLSPYGLKALVKSGQLTHQEANDLNKTKLPPSQYAYILLVWVGLHTMKAIREGLIEGGAGLEQNLLQQLTSLRACMFDIDDLRAGRMPLAKVQLVQVLVDSLVAISPFGLYAELGILSVPLVGLLAFFFRGLLILSKSFLDPFGVEGFEEQNIRVDVLVSEVNFGASKRWIQAGATLPKVG